MMEIESQWIGRKISELVEGNEGLSILNVGSSTGHFRRVAQPHVHANIFGPLEDRCTVDHLDMKPADGVDLVGDLADPRFLEDLRRREYDGLLCSNLLEHVLDPLKTCQCMEACVKSGGFMVVTVPHQYPYHGDPIDTKLRVDVDGLKALFADSDLVEGEIIQSDQNHLKHLLSNHTLLVRTVVRWFTPFYQFETWKKVVADIPHTLRPYSVACIVLRKR